MLATVVCQFLLASLARAVPIASCASTAQWHGWSSLKHAFIFGDSYTATGFNYTLDPPSPSNPLGNPTYWGWTSSNGPNWVDFLTVKYNASLLMTYNLAYGGATVDSDLIAPYESTVLSLKDQVLSEFIPAYTGSAPTAPSAPAWAGNDTLFSIWIGINDVGNTYWELSSGANGTADINSQVFAVYSALVDTLYDAGARNFLFINVPAVDRSPLITAQGATAAGYAAEDINIFNGLIASLAGSLKSNHSDDANVWVFDSDSLFNKVLNDTKAFPQTSIYKNTTSYCEAYENGTTDTDSYDATCGIPVNEYFWLNSLHPTYPMHDVVAQQVASSLAAGPNICDRS